MHDTLLSVFVLWSILLLIRTVDSKELRTFRMLIPYFMSGLIIGVAAGLKITIGIYILGMGVSLALGNESWPRRTRVLISWWAGSIVGVAASGGFWMIYLWQQFKNPLFPFYNKIFKSPYFELINFSDDRFFPRNTWQHLFYPFFFSGDKSAVMEPVFQDFRFAVIYLALIFFFILRLYRFLSDKSHSQTTGHHHSATRQNKADILIIAFFICSYVVWQFTFSIYRYLAPLELLSGVMLYVLLKSVFRSLPVRTVFLTGICIFLIASLDVPTWGRKNWSDDYFGVKAPVFEDPQNILILIGSYDPLSYLIPSFQEEIRFVRIEGNFIKPWQSNRMTERIRDLITSHKGKFFILIHSNSLPSVPNLIRNYALQLTPDSKYKIISGVEPGLVLLQCHFISG